MKRILLVVGTRPNFIKITQFKKEALNFPELELKIVHTGQHFSANMVDVFFEQFQVQPDYYLGIDPASPNTQMAHIMLKLEELIQTTFTPDVMLVVGDVNSTLAAALTANKMRIKVAHLESGLRSFDKNMPEEINRLLTDELSDYYFVTEEHGMQNLQAERKTGKAYLVGNTMVDTLVAFQDKIDAAPIVQALKLTPHSYALMTMHRPATVDFKEGLSNVVAVINAITRDYTLVFPIHPRTVAKLKEFGFYEQLQANKNLHLTDPQGYFEFQQLVKNCAFVLTDSGGLQGETTFYQKPCLTLRDNTEQPCTIAEGTNTLVPFDLEVLQSYVTQIKTGDYKKGQVPKGWDGKTTKRVLEILTK